MTNLEDMKEKRVDDMYRLTYVVYIINSIVFYSILIENKKRVVLPRPQKHGNVCVMSVFSKRRKTAVQATRNVYYLIKVRKKKKKNDCQYYSCNIKKKERCLIK